MTDIDINRRRHRRLMGYLHHINWAKQFAGLTLAQQSITADLRRHLFRVYHRILSRRFDPHGNRLYGFTARNEPPHSCGILRVASPRPIHLDAL